MRKMLYVLAIALIPGAGITRADNPQGKITSAEKVAAAQDGQSVVLHGAIVGRQDTDDYILSDGSADVLVEIKRELTKGQELAIGAEVEISGKVDKNTPKVVARSVSAYSGE